MKNSGVPHLQTPIQSLRKDYENLSMEDDKLVLDYFGKLSWIVIELKSLGEKISDADLSAKLLRSVSGKFDLITSSIEQFQDLDAILVEEVLGTLKIHEDKLQDRSIKREESLIDSHSQQEQKERFF